MYQALLFSGDADIAFVDVNLEDGPTGPVIGRTLADTDLSVLFMTSDPGAIQGGVPGALGVIQNPVLDLELVEAIQYVVIGALEIRIYHRRSASSSSRLEDLAAEIGGVRLAASTIRDAFPLAPRFGQRLP